MDGGGNPVAQGADQSLIAELEAAIQHGTPEKRVETLRRITDLFLLESDRLDDRQIGVFGDVFLHLVERVESGALFELSKHLASEEKAPLEVIRRLARDDDFGIAGPVLAQSRQLTDSDLIDVARSKGQGHLMAMSTRALLTESVTDVLIERGNLQVSQRLASNSGARFSDTGYSSLAERAETDALLAEALGARIDMPPALFRQLLQKATVAVRDRLMASASPAHRRQIEQALASSADKLAREARTARDYSRSDSLVKELNRQGKLNEQLLHNFAADRRYEEMVATLALFCQAPIEVIEALMSKIPDEGVLIACKAAKLGWPTASAILQARFSQRQISEEELARAMDSYLKLTPASAQRTLRFMLVQHTARKKS